MADQALIGFTYRDPQGGRFAPNAGSHQIGTVISVKFSWGLVQAVLVAVVVAPDGMSVDLTIEPLSVQPPGEVSGAEPEEPVRPYPKEWITGGMPPLLDRVDDWAARDAFLADGHADVSRDSYHQG